ncbi:MAG: hypothetical protein ACD_75C02624G0001 [uncultured bacterium]|nr:MAG: hypothetical protein ACD_75C02624G0001 [uncultured bacterium]
MKKAIWIVLLLVATVISASAGEEERLNERRDIALKECKGDSQCRVDVQKQYKKALHNLLTDPKLYWREGGGSTSEGRMRRIIRQELENQ